MCFRTNILYRIDSWPFIPPSQNIPSSLSFMRPKSAFTRYLSHTKSTCFHRMSVRIQLKSKINKLITHGCLLQFERTEKKLFVDEKTQKRIFLEKRKDSKLFLAEVWENLGINFFLSLRRKGYWSKNGKVPLKQEFWSNLKSCKIYFVFNKLQILVTESNLLLSRSMVQ